MLSNSQSIWLLQSGDSFLNQIFDTEFAADAHNQYQQDIGDWEDDEYESVEFHLEKISMDLHPLYEEQVQRLANIENLLDAIELTRKAISDGRRGHKAQKASIQHAIFLIEKLNAIL